MIRDPDAAHDDAVQRADLEGWDAGVEGKGPEANPYLDAGRETYLARYWEESRQMGARQR